MSDIAMCQVSECPRKLECYRYMAIPDQWQSYMIFDEICLNNNFKWFYEIDGKKVRKIENPDSTTVGAEQV